MSNRIELPDPIAALRHDAVNAARDAGFQFDGRYSHWIKPRGKFEGEPYWLPYYYNLALDGGADSDPFYNPDSILYCAHADVFTLSPLERAAFDFSDDDAFLLVTYSEQGFIGHRLISSAEHDRLRAEYEADAEGNDNDDQD